MSIEAAAELYWGIRYEYEEVKEPLRNLLSDWVQDGVLSIDETVNYAEPDILDLLEGESCPTELSSPTLDEGYFHPVAGQWRGGTDNAFILGFNVANAYQSGGTHAIDPSLLNNNDSWCQKLEAIAKKLNLPWREPSWYLMASYN